MLQSVRTFAEHVRQRRRLELSLVVFFGLCGLAMGGTGSRAYHSLDHRAPLHRPTPQVERVRDLVVVQATAVYEIPAHAALPPPRECATPVADFCPSATPPRHVARAPGRVRGPPSAPHVCI